MMAQESEKSVGAPLEQKQTRDGRDEIRQKLTFPKVHSKSQKGRSSVQVQMRELDKEYSENLQMSFSDCLYSCETGSKIII